MKTDRIDHTSGLSPSSLRSCLRLSKRPAKVSSVTGDGGGGGSLDGSIGPVLCSS